MKRVLITGGSGFIGSNLVEAFNNRYRIFSPMHEELDLMNSDATRDYIKGNAIDCIVHCANIGGGRDAIGKIGTFEGNLKMFFNLIRTAPYVKKIIHMGSGAEYDKRRALINISEGAFDSHVPIDDYGYAKYLCSKYIISAREYSIVALRLFGVFGKYENYLYRFISNSIVKNLLGMPMTIVQNVNFDFLSVNDLPTVVGHFIDHSFSERAYNVTSGQVNDLVSIARIINEIADSRSSIHIRHGGFNNEYSGDNTLLKSEISGISFTPIASSIMRLYDYYKEMLPRLDVDSIRKDEYLQYCTVRSEMR